MDKPFFLALLLSGCLVVSLHAQVNTGSLESRLNQVDGTERIEVLLSLTAAHQRNDPPQAIVYGREALALLRTFPDAEREVDVLYHKGRAHLWLSEYDSASVHAEHAEAIALASGYTKGRALALNLKGTIQSLQGYFDQGLVHFLEALAIWEETGDREGIGNALNNIGIVNMRRGNLDEALDFYLRALTVWEEIGDKGGIARVLNNTGNVHRDLGNLDEALDYANRAFAIREEIGDRRGMAIALNGVGLVQRRLGNEDQALDFLQRACMLAEEVGDLHLVEWGSGVEPHFRSWIRLKLISCLYEFILEYSVSQRPSFAVSLVFLRLHIDPTSVFPEHNNVVYTWNCRITLEAERLGLHANDFRVRPEPNNPV